MGDTDLCGSLRTPRMQPHRRQRCSSVVMQNPRRCTILGFEGVGEFLLVAASSGMGWLLALGVDKGSVFQPGHVDDRSRHQSCACSFQ